MVAYGHEQALLGESDVSLYGMALSTLGVQILFTVSGYLVMTSYVRRPKGFIIRRAKRIYPLWITYLIVMALIIGPIISRLSAGEYFSSVQTWRYLFSNAYFMPEYYLPGVFDSKYLGANVNISIWTLPFEMFGYLLIAVSGFVIQLVVKRKPEKDSRSEPYERLNLFWIIPAILLYLYQMIFDYAGKFYIGSVEIWGGCRLLAYFAFGAGAALLRLEKYIRLEVTIVLIVVLYYFPGMFSDVLLYFTVAYGILAFGKAPMFYPKSVAKVDMAYELFIWAFPCQQMVLIIKDRIQMSDNVNVLFLTSIILAIVLGIISQRLIKGVGGFLIGKVDIQRNKE